ncbi:major facilitator superfamily domain-containing protein [Cantharellus anzutake]|uniref:major facilitator superfamily domain-containing protein n=1 Tax=Cantharellus anzutake TaxID=1750568 RepID=UPI001907467C|nr:major facilitator superfamily domain-containing protein [Cantharellus anzutake]KAF8341364.1 major facilitator superfamily domain-containing protein [Cantharellus anzutake]
MPQKERRTSLTVNFPSHEEDPTSQIPWPSGRRSDSQPGSPEVEEFRAPLHIPGTPTPSELSEDEDGPSAALAKRRGSVNERALKKHMTTMDLFALSISMAGAQIIWTMELGWGTPFLLDMGLSESATSLVWLAGPISGLIAQPLIGAISDASTSKYRRRAWIVGATVTITVVSLILAFTNEISGFIVDLFGGGAGDWDPVRKGKVNSTAIAISIASFYFLDFALNALQASLRNLLLDITPSDQLAEANAWHGRMTHAGNVIGFGIGFLNLAEWKILHFLGGSQFRKVCILSLVVLIITVWWTCWTQIEVSGAKGFKNREEGLHQIFKNIYSSVVNLPKPVRRVCFVQVCAFMGWFPFLFYGTTWIGEVMARERGLDPPVEEATRAGDFAMLWYSIVAIFAGTLLPWLNQRDRRLLASEEDENVDQELARIRAMVREWKAEAARAGKPLQLPTMPFMLRNIWTAALVLFVAVMASTFFIQTVFHASVAISILGICWAVACWIPFAIIMSFLKEMEDEAEEQRKQAATVAPYRSRPHHRVASVPSNLYKQRNQPNERTQLVRRHSLMGETGAFSHDLRYVGSAPVAGGTILGIHNLAIVFPQFLIAIISSAIFRITDRGLEHDPPYVYYGKDGVSWVLRVGGCFALFGALLSRMVPPTKTEKEMRRRLADMMASEEENP